MWWSFWCGGFPSQVGVWSVLRKEWMWEKHLTWWCRDSMRMLQFSNSALPSWQIHPEGCFIFPPILVQTDLKVFGYPNPRLWSSGWSECHSSRDGSQLPALNTAFWSWNINFPLVGLDSWILFPPWELAELPKAPSSLWSTTRVALLELQGENSIQAQLFLLLWQGREWQAVE